MKKVLVTGTEGDVGSVLLPQFANRFDAVGFDLRPHEGPMNAIQGDLLDYEDVLAAADGKEAIVHMAALLPQQGTPTDSVDINVKATANLLQAAVELGIKRFVYCSTVWATGHGDTEPYLPIDEDTPCAPVCMYGHTKLQGELMTEFYGREHGLETVVIRFCGYCTVKGYGPDGSIDWESAHLTQLFRRYFAGGYKLMNPVDLGLAFGAAVENPKAAGERFVVGASTPYTSADAAGLRSMPIAVADRYYPGAADLLNQLGIEIPPATFYYSHEKARTLLGFRSQHDLGDLVRMYKEWQSK